MCVGRGLNKKGRRGEEGGGLGRLVIRRKLQNKLLQQAREQLAREQQAREGRDKNPGHDRTSHLNT